MVAFITSPFFLSDSFIYPTFFMKPVSISLTQSIFNSKVCSMLDKKNAYIILVKNMQNIPILESYYKVANSTPCCLYMVLAFYQSLTFCIVNQQSLPIWVGQKIHLREGS